MKETYYDFYSLGGIPVETNFLIEKDEPSTEIRNIVVENTGFVGSTKYDNTRYMAWLMRKHGPIKTIKVVRTDKKTIVNFVKDEK